jgi:ABC-type transport system involved in multi-copper enzyme maturation permease subunit
MARNVALVLSLAFIGLLGFLTVSVAISDGVTILVVVSIVILAILGFGVLGALTQPSDD